MHGLLEAACGYLIAGGYDVVRKEADFVELRLASESSAASLPIKIWAGEHELARSAELSRADLAERAARESALLARITHELTTPARGFYLVANRQGLSRSFIEEATRLLEAGGGGIRVPMEFFDSPYRRETGARGARSRKARSILEDVLDLAQRQKRVAQPFFVRHGLGPDDIRPGDGDLVEHLDRVLRESHDRATLHVIDGSAGVGKSVAFAALTDLLYNEFRAAKEQRIHRRRPIVFLPEHVRGEPIGYVDDILDAVVESEIASVVEPGQLRWLLERGYALWMFDGLDEIYGGDNDFFQAIGGLLSAQGSRAQILLCSRDSLLTSSARMREFISHRLQTGADTRIYELAPWGPAAWENIAWLEIERGREDKRSSPRVRAFVNALEGSPELAQLASLPFYCTLLLEQYREKGSMPSDRLELLDYIVNCMVDREQAKGIFVWRDFFDFTAMVNGLDLEAAEEEIALPQTVAAERILDQVLDAEGRRSLMELLGAMAHQMCRSSAPNGAPAQMSVLDTDVLREVFSEPYLAGGLDVSDSQRVLAALVQFAFFGPGRRAGSVDFAHPILAQYLAGRYAAAMLADEALSYAQGRSNLQRMRLAFSQAIGPRPLEAGTVFEAVVRRAVAESAEVRTFLDALAGSGSPVHDGAANVLERLTSRVAFAAP